MNFERVIFSIRNPPEHYLIIFFDHKDERICNAYNNAIPEILEKVWPTQTRPQVGFDEKTGLFGWEVWGSTDENPEEYKKRCPWIKTSPVSSKDIESHFDAIHQMAEELYKDPYFC